MKNRTIDLDLCNIQENEIVYGNSKYTFISEFGKMEELLTEIKLQYIGKKNCICGFKILERKEIYQGKELKNNFNNGELLINKLTNEITISIYTDDIYNNKIKLILTSILKRCNNKWTGTAIYTNGLPGNSAIQEFKFINKSKYFN